VELGLFTLAELPPAGAGAARASAERLQNLLEEIVLADEVGLDVFGVGEHHRADYAVSAPAIVLAAAAARTRRIRLTSAVSVLSSDDPVRVFQDFATLDLLSNGRAEIMAGRGSFIESFPLFGYNLHDYDALFEEKLELLLRLRESERVSWSGRFRAPIDDLAVYPRPLQQPLPVWLAVGGAPESALRAGRLGLPMALAIIGGAPERFVSYAELQREAGRRAGHDPAALRLSINSHGFLATDSSRAAAIAYPPFRAQMERIGRERGWPPFSREAFEADRGPRGALFVGSPAELTEKILYQHELFGHDRFLLQLSVGSIPQLELLRAIELFGTEVAPAVRAALGPPAEPSREGLSVSAR
jgi:probable LLM family oxidoreductase